MRRLLQPLTRTYSPTQMEPLAGAPFVSMQISIGDRESATVGTHPGARMTVKIAPHLARLHACAEATEWCADKTIDEAWSTCHRADWMLWLAGRVLDRKIVVRAAVECARTALVHTKDPRPGECLAVVQRWTEGTATIEDVRAAAAAAYAAAAAADAAAADAADASASDADASAIRESALQLLDRLIDAA